MNAALLFIVTNCTCGWAVFYLLAEPAIFALILMVVRLRPNAAQCSPMQVAAQCMQPSGGEAAALCAPKLHLYVLPKLQP